MSTVSNNIKYLRRMNGLTQEQFARKIGIKRSLLGAYEEARANPNLENLMNIAKIFGTTVDNLIKNDLRTLKETRGVPLPQPSHQLAIKDTPEPPKQLADLLDKYYRPSTNSLPFASNQPAEKPKPDIRPIPQQIAFQPVNATIQAPTLVTQLPQPAPATHFTSSAPASNFTTTPSTTTDKSKQTIEWVKQTDIAEYLSSYAYAEYLKQLPVFQLPLLPTGKYRAFEAGADFSQPGSVLVGQFVNNWYDIKDGQQYIIVIHKQGILYRRIYNQVKIKGTLLLSSDNPAISSVEVSIKEVLEVWEVKLFISNTLPEPSVGPSLDRLHGLVMALQEEIERLKK
jgi:transcriptional regulator with XRE-family HTH domain